MPAPATKPVTVLFRSSAGLDVVVLLETLVGITVCVIV